MSIISYNLNVVILVFCVEYVVISDEDVDCYDLKCPNMIVFFECSKCILFVGHILKNNNVTKVLYVNTKIKRHLI